METVDNYIAAFDPQIQEVLQKIRKVILSRNKDITEAMAYGLPAYRLGKKPIVYFGAFKKHIGFYATPNGQEEFKERLSRYKKGKGSVQFPLSEELPYGLIQEIVDFRLKSVS